MKKLNITILISSIIVLLSSFNCYAQNKVNIHSSVNPADKTFFCEYKIVIEPDSKQSTFLFNLNSDFRIKEIRSKKRSRQSVEPYFDSFQKDTLKRIAVDFLYRSKAKREITISYSGKVPHKSFTDDVIELSAHSNWLPNIPDKEYEIVDYLMEVTIEGDGEVISTSAPVEQDGNSYTFKGQAPNIEITAIIAKDTHKLTLETEAGKVEILKAGENLKSSDTVLINHTEDIISYYNKTIGQEEPITNFIILLPHTNRDAFGLLDNAVNITYSDFDTKTIGDKLILAHEISHKWWAYGQWNDYNNWLNEAFATYSSLLYIRAIGDTATFKNEIAERIESSANIPAIINFDVSKYDYKTFRKVLYDKGTVALFELHKKIGDKEFLTLLSKAAGAKLTTTDQLLDLIEQQEGKELRIWFYCRIST